MRAYLGGNAAALRATAGAPYSDIAAALDRMDEEMEEYARDLQRLTEESETLKKAMEAVRTWKFEPAKKDGQAVAVQLNIEVSFRLY